MKKLLFFLFAIALFASCDRSGLLDPNATVLIRPDASMMTRTQTAGLSAMEIVERADVMTFMSYYADNVRQETPTMIQRGFAEAQRDFSIPALKMWGTDIISTGGAFEDGTLVRDFLYATDVFIAIIDWSDPFAPLDTIAYIPNHILESARIRIEDAHRRGNFREVYRLFDEAFTFFPISE